MGLTIRIQFDQIVQLPVIEVFDQDGHNHAAAAAFARGRDVSAKVRKLPTGAYTVRWHVLSSDGHVVSGVWTFGVRVKAPPPTEAYGASGPTRTEHVVRWLYFLALALVIGALGFRLILLRGVAVPPTVDKRLLLLAGIGAAGVLEVGIAAFLLRCEDVLQLPFGKFLYGDLSPISGGTRYGKTFVAVTLGFALVAAFIYLAWLFDRPNLLVPAPCACGHLRGWAFVLGPRRGGSRLVGKSELADWCISPPCRCGSAVVALAVVWRAAPALQRDSSRASRGSRRCSSRWCLRRGRISRSCGCRTCTTCGVTAMGRCCSSSSHLSRSCLRGAACIASSCAPRSRER